MKEGDLCISWLLFIWTVLVASGESKPPESAFTRRFNTSTQYYYRRPGYCENKTAFDCDEHFVNGGVFVCIDPDKVKDGHEDCIDGSDEWCTHEELRCGTQGKCVPIDQFAEQCPRRANRNLCMATDRYPVPCRGYPEECVLRAWLRDNQDFSEYDCLDESDEDCEYVARFLTAKEMNEKGCNSTTDGSMLPDIPESNSQNFWNCFNNTARKALERFADTPMCKCRPGSVYDANSESCKTAPTKSFQFKNDKLCGENNIYSEGLKDQQSIYYRSVAAIMLDAISEIIENSTINPKPQLCFPKMDMNKGSVLFGIQIECQSNAKSCDANELRNALQSSNSLQSSVEMDKNYIQDITSLNDDRCSECDPNANCTLENPPSTPPICNCKKGFKDFAITGLEAGRNCTAIVLIVTSTSTSSSTTQQQQPESTSPDTTTTTTVAARDEPTTESTVGTAGLKWYVIVIIVLAILLFLILVVCLCWRWCGGMEEEQQSDQVQPIMMSPSNSDKRSAWSVEETVTALRSPPAKPPSSPSSLPTKKEPAETHQVQTVIEDNSTRLVDTPTMWEEYQRGKLVISPPPVQQTSQLPQTSHQPTAAPSVPPIPTIPTVEIVDEENSLEGSDELKDEDEYSLWKKQIAIQDDLYNMEDPLGESLGKHGHPNVPSSQTPENLNT